MDYQSEFDDLLKPKSTPQPTINNINTQINILRDIYNKQKLSDYYNDQVIHNNITNMHLHYQTHTNPIGNQTNGVEDHDEINLSDITDDLIMSGRKNAMI